MKERYKRFFLAVGFGITALMLIVAPHGWFQPQPPHILTDAAQIFYNPDLTSSHANWSRSDWSSAGLYPTNAQITPVNGEVILSQSGYRESFYAVAITQGGSPAAFDWAPWQMPYVSVNSSFHNVITWRGKMDSANLMPAGCLGMGIDFWFDAEFPDGTLKPVELYVFFYMKGVYAIPVASYKAMIREDYNHTSGKIDIIWDYIYFHHSQDTLGAYTTHTFELHDYVVALKQQLPTYRNAQFWLARVDACMELFMGSGQFTIDYLGLQQKAR